ncbi:MAG TPA: hypothetical protein VF310_10030 [Vicinamibacteria bacterium]
MKTLRLSLAAAEWLVADSGLEFEPVSPLASVQGRSSAEARAAAARAELHAVGITFDHGGPAAAPAVVPFCEALALLAHPRARLQVVTQAAGKPPIKLTLFARDGQACAFVSDKDSFQIGPRRALDATFAAIQDQVRAPRELEGKQILFWPSVIGILVKLWPGNGQDLDQSVSREQALERLGLPAEAKEKGASVVAELADKGLLAHQDGGLAVPLGFRPWLQAALSGHLVQLDVLALDGAAALEQAEARTARLLFVGPPGARVLSQTLAGEELAAVLKGGAPNEPRAIHLSALPPARLGELLRAHLGLGAPV